VIRDARLQFGTHLDYYGELCDCTMPSRKPAPQSRPAAAVVARPVVEPKKVTRVPMWDEGEREQARRRGFEVRIQSQGGFRNG